MDNPSTPNTETQQILHTGKLEGELRETPVREFDKTTLNEAVENDLIITPSSPAELNGNAPENKSRKRLGIILGSSAAAIALAAGGIFAVNAANQPPKNQPVATASGNPTPEATPSPSATSNEKEPTVQSLEIPATLTPEQIGVTLIQDRISQWEMAGATKANQSLYLQGDGSIVNQIADKNTSTFTEALFAPNWQSNASLSAIADYETKNNASNIEDWFKTYHATPDSKATFPQDFEPYSRSVTVDQGGVTVVSHDADSTVLSIAATEHENLHNRIGDPSSNLYESNVVNGGKFIAKVTTKVIDGNVKVVSMEFVNP